LRKNSRRLRVKALPKNLPDFIEVDITPLKIGNKLYVTALENDAYKIMHPDNTVVCQIKRARAAMAIAAEEDDEETEGVEGTEGGETPEVAAEAQE
ncbi:MAG TPA: 50S ribosomal protein L25, partial [Xanthomarina gelatinilytica]|nr:50S ribosomal protein L25 [Xanthomarina gelatinilytica]